MLLRLFLLNLLVINALRLAAQNPPLYFPPKTGSAWATTDPASLGWCQPRIDSLYQFLADEHTKGFLLLKDGKIVLEKYFGTFQQDSIWYWASAGKTLTAALVGIAKQENLLALDQPAADFLGAGWTSCTPAQESAITVRHLLEMTSGLDDTPTGTTDPNSCTDPACFQYLAEPGTRWAYHTGAYRMLQPLVAKAGSAANVNVFCKNKILDKTGMKGLYVNDVFFSRPRDMARFGLLMLANGAWDGDKIISDTAFLHEMTHTSQPLNKSYGYLTWLNGQSSFMLPTLQVTFPGSLVPAAPADTYMALGKNDQKIHVSPSKGLVVVRMGDAAGSGGGGDVPVAFDQQLWLKINALACSTAAQSVEDEAVVSIFPNPTGGEFSISNGWERVSLFDGSGRLVRVFQQGERLSVNGMGEGFCFLKIELGGKVIFRKLVLE